MEIIRIPLYPSNVPIPDIGKRDPDEPPIKYGLENMLTTYALAKVPDPENIVVTEGTALAAIGVTASLTLLSNTNWFPLTWLNTGTNKLKFRVKGTLQVAYANTIETLLSTYNVLVLNAAGISSTPYGGFLVLTIGAVGSGADLILTDQNIRNGKFIATFNRVSKEF